MQKISSEELFDIWHLQSNCIDVELHSMENGDVEFANKARDIRHELNGLIFDKMDNPQHLCTYKHLLSVRMELMELMEKWNKRGQPELVKFAQESLNEVSDKLLDLIEEIREEPLEIIT